MSFTVQEIKERDAALIVLESEPPSDHWFRMWEDWFAKQAGEHKAEYVHQLFHYARLGVEREQEVRTAARIELAEMLESLARQVKPIAQTPPKSRSIHRREAAQRGEEPPEFSSGVETEPLAVLPDIVELVREYRTPVGDEPTEPEQRRVDREASGE